MVTMLGSLEDTDLENRIASPPQFIRRTASLAMEIHHGQVVQNQSEGPPPSSYNSSATEIYKNDPIADHQESLQDFIFHVATSFISYGAPSHRIQSVVEALGKALDTPTSVFSMTTHTMLSFPSKWKRGPPAIYYIDKSGSMNFTKLPHIFNLVKGIIRRPENVSMESAYTEMEKIRAMENAWGEYAISASYVAAATTSAIMFFGGNWKDAAMSGVLAIIPALLRLVANKWEMLWWIHECTACFLISLVAIAISKHFCYSTLVLSAPVTLLPGYTVSISVVEIMTKNTVAGCIRLCYTMAYLCCMVLGLTLAPILYNAPIHSAGGVGFQRSAVNINRTCDTAQGIVVNRLWLFLCVPVYICAYNVYLKSPLRQWPLMIAVGSLGYGAGFASKHVWHAPPELNAFIATFTLGFFANLYARITDDFAFNGIVAGVFIQVPGSWGIRGLLSFAYGNYEKGIYWSYSMFAICVSISVALIITNHLFFGFMLLNRGAPHMDF